MQPAPHWRGRPMSSKRRLRRKSCEGKVRHVDPNAAQAAARSLVRAGKSRGGIIRVYCCSFCNGYHLGHAPGSMSIQGKNQR